MHTLTASYATGGWDETTIETTAAGIKVTRARTPRTFTGDITGKGVAEYILVHHADETTTYSGLMYFEGSVKGRDKGEAVFITAGTYNAADGPKAHWYLDEKSGTGGFKDLQARGGYKVGASGDMSAGMDCWLELIG